MSVSASAPGKIILFGEHAVVYGYPAIAVPVTQVQATAEVKAGRAGFQIRATDIGGEYRLEEAPQNDPLAAAVRATLEQLGASPPPCVLSVRSNIRVASGLGSGTAVSVAIVRALSGFLGRPLDDTLVSDIAFEIDKLHHGTPSGIDNTVIASRTPVYYLQGQPVQTFEIGGPFQLLIADSGVACPTKATVAEVRAAWRSRPDSYEALFQQIGHLVDRARAAIEGGRTGQLGRLMTRNQTLLTQLEVSSDHLEALIQAALEAGAEGAKLSGGGRGGNVIALVQPETQERVRQALLQAGAVNVISTWVNGNG